MHRLHVDNENKGLVFNIQKFSVHDGPGIRTTVFFKGCPLRCLWCSNPESQSFYPELMVRDIVCKGCGACIKTCPQNAITMSKEKGRTINRKKCNQCLICVQACLYQSLQQCGKHMCIEEVINEILQDVIFYKNSGGGVTVSGGEPLSQYKFVKALLAECKKNGLHTVLETSGYAPWKEMVNILNYVDLILFDIKHLDSEEHKKNTGVDNKKILENLKKTAMTNDIWLRIPLITGFNDSEDHIKKVALLGKEISAQKISLLPYHEGGKSKCDQLGRTYAFAGNKSPGERQLNKLKQEIEKLGLEATVSL